MREILQTCLRADPTHPRAPSLAGRWKRLAAHRKSVVSNSPAAWLMRYSSPKNSTGMIPPAVAARWCASQASASSVK